MSTAFLAILCVFLITVVVVQIGRVVELAAKIRGEEEVQDLTNRRHGFYMIVFMVIFLVGCVWSALYFKNYMMGFGPHQSASKHGSSLDYLFKVTTFFTGIVFFITQIALFYFANKFAGQRGRSAWYMPHDNRLEKIWTAVPAVVMTFLVIGGLDAWNEVMADIDPNEDYIEIEATGYQFAWNLRYPGPDGQLGARDFKLISGSNTIGQDWTDAKGADDIYPDMIVLPKGKKVRVRITARDVLHNFYLPHFRVKMDAVPGMPTYFVFTPTLTTEEYRQQLRNYPEYQKTDPNEPEKQLWETFNYELACAELCGNGHFSMRRLVRIVSDEEYKAWLASQQSYYLTNIRGTEDDPNKDKLFDFEIKQRKQEFTDAFDKAIQSANATDKVLKFNYVNFETGSAKLTPVSKYELDNLVEALNKNTALAIEISGHTDNTGDPDSNQTLSQERAQAVYSYLVDKGIAADRLSAVGFGQTRPVDSNDTEEGRQKNRRTEFKIVRQ